MINKNEILERRYRNKKSSLRAGMSIFLILILFMSFFSYRYISKGLTSIQGEKVDPENLGITDEVKQQITKYNNKTKNILLLGIDEPDNPGDPQRSDAMMIFSIDTKNKVIKMSSLMRDTYVNIPGNGEDKLNHAFAYGGVQLSLKTVNMAFDMDITDYVLVNYHNLIQIIDSVGGIDMEVTELEVPLLNEAIVDINSKEMTSVPFIEKAGNVHLNGTQATAYSRIRRAGPNDTDYKRAERQRSVLLKLFIKLKTTPIYKIPTTVNSLSGFVKTSLSSDEMIELGSQVILDNISEVKQQRFPTVNTSEEVNDPQLWYLKYYKEETVKELHNFIYKNIEPDLKEKD